METNQGPVAGIPEQERRDSPLEAAASIKAYLAALGKFLQYYKRRGVFDHGFHKLVILPTLSKDEGQDERWLSRETAQEILSHLETTLHAFDLDDYDAGERYIAAVNREDTGTRLKNGYSTEREISISEDTARAIDGYI